MKPDDIPQDVWERACACVPDYVKTTIKTDIARAIQSAKAEERQRCINALQLMILQHGEPGSVAENPYINLRTAIAAIRKLGE